MASSVIRLDRWRPVEIEGWPSSDLAKDLHVHVVLAGIFSGHAQDRNGFTLTERRNSLRSDTPRLERDGDRLPDSNVGSPLRRQCAAFQTHLARILMSL